MAGGRGRAAGAVPGVRCGQPVDSRRAVPAAVRAAGDRRDRYGESRGGRTRWRGRRRRLEPEAQRSPLSSAYRRVRAAPATPGVAADGDADGRGCGTCAVRAPARLVVWLHRRAGRDLDARHRSQASRHPGAVGAPAADGGRADVPAACLARGRGGRRGAGRGHRGNGCRGREDRCRGVPLPALRAHHCRSRDRARHTPSDDARRRDRHNRPRRCRADRVYGAVRMESHRSRGRSRRPRHHGRRRA